MKYITIFLKDRICRNFLKGKIDRIAILTKDTRVFGVDTVFIRNGYEFGKDDFNIRYEKKDTINIAAAAAFDWWHGYERLVYGLAEYYKKGGTVPFIIHFAGNGPELSYYRKIVKKTGMEKHVRFYGMRDKNFLKGLYADCEFGCCSLGVYKKGLRFSCELKSREYLAAGLPMLASCRLDIDSDRKLARYIVRFPNDGTWIDFQKIADAHANLYKNKSQDEIITMRRSIKNRAAELLHMGRAMEYAVEYINAACQEGIV